MAKYIPEVNDQQKHVVFSSLSSELTTKERVRRAFARRQQFLCGATVVPSELTEEMKQDIEMGRPVINQ